MKIFVCRSVTFDSPSSWRKDVCLVDERGYVNSQVSNFPVQFQGVVRRWFEFWFACKVLWQTSQNSSIAVGRYGLWVPILAKLLHLKRHVVLTDVEWPKV